MSPEVVDWALAIGWKIIAAPGRDSASARAVKRKERIETPLYRSYKAKVLSLLICAVIASPTDILAMFSISSNN
jgi:hypothetical protein